MIYSIKALIYLGAVSSFMLFVTRPMLAGVVSKEKLGQWAIIWLTMTAVAFLIPNYWLMVFCLAVIVSFASRVEPNNAALFLLAAAAVPMVGKDIPGLLGINRLLAPTPQFIFAAILLLPLYLMNKQKEKLKYADIAVYAFFALTTFLTLRDSSVTNMLRTAVQFFVAVFLPYYAMSRMRGTVEDFRHLVMAFVFPMLALAGEGLFELVRDWHLYGHLPAFWGIPDVQGQKLYRDGLLRSYGLAFGPIVFGYMFMVAAGLLLSVHSSRFRGNSRYILLGILGAGLVSTVSRGPMVGLAAILLVYLLFSDSKFKNFGRLALIGLFLFVPLMFTSVGQGLLSYVPFIGDVDAGNTSYRVRLFENSMTVILRNPLFGSVNYLETPEMLEMVQGQGIIDLVNSYIQIALEYGFVGVLLFVSIFLSVLRGLRRSIRALPLEDVELRQMGVGLMATLCGVLVTIATVSSLGFIPLLYWSLAGLGGAYIRMVERRLEEAAPENDEWVPAYASG
jgi:hypothetical protein